MSLEEQLSSSSLSSKEAIQLSVDFSSGNYSTTDSLGSFINNSEFMQGFIDYVQNKSTSKAYVWKCLSAVSEDLGDALYKNVKNYIDYVSNIDTCKVQALRSMMRELGFEYTVFDNIESVPREVLDLLNVVSIDKKYLLKNEFMQKAFIEDMRQLSVMISVDAPKEDYYQLEEESTDISNYSTTTFYIDDNRYQDYIEYLFKTLLHGFCTLEYNQRSANSLSTEHYYIYKTIKLDDNNDITDIEYASTYDKDIEDFKSLHRIDPKFDCRKIADDIDNGIDSIDNYQYPLSGLIQLELSRRASKLSKDELTATLPNQTSGYDKSESIKDQTRYSYYRKQKVLEYINFVNNKYFIDNAAEISSRTYEFDRSFIEVLANGTNYVLSSNDGKTVINEDIISKVAKSLAIAAQYICKLRRRLKLQAQKTYMKGTQNLLLFIINEYLIDYSRHKLQTTDFSKYEDTDGSTMSQVSAVLHALSSHQLDNIEVIEYYDQTQYYNLSTDATSNAFNEQDANDKFWKKIDIAADDGISYKLDQISKFYQNVMHMKDVLSDAAELSDFLDTIFDVGADKSHMTSDDKMFSTQLSAYNGRYSDAVYGDCISLSSQWKILNDYLDGRDYTYPKNTMISDQLSDVKNFISSYLTDEKMSKVSSVQEEYEPLIFELSNSFSQLSAKYYSFLSGDMSFYFKKSDNKHCYSQTESGSKYYKHDWYIDNPIYSNEDGYLLYELQNFRQFIDAEGLDEKNVVNWPLIDTVTAVSSECARICAEYKAEVAAAIQLSGLSGFYDINAPTLDDELKNGYDYLNDRINRRFEFLQKNLENVRAQANQLRSDFNRVKENFAAAVASYNDNESTINLGATSLYEVSKRKITRDNVSHIGFAFNNFCNISEAFPNDDVIWVQKIPSYDKYVGVTQNMDDGKQYYNGNYPYIKKDLPKYREDDTIESRILAFLAFQNTPTLFTPTRDTVSKLYVISQEEYGLRNEGSYSAAVQCKQNVEALGIQTASVVKLVNEIGGKLDISGENGIENKINAVIEYISTNFNEGCFENDSLILLMRQLMSKIDVLQTQYKPYKADFQQLRNDPTQATYLNGLAASELTFESLKEHLEYAKETDDKNRAELILTEEKFENDLDDFYTEYSTIADQLQKLEYEWQCKDWREDGILYEPYVDKSSGIVEIGLSDAIKFLTKDIEVKSKDAEAEVTRIIDSTICESISTISSYLSSSMKSDQLLDIAVNDEIEFLNVFNDKQYNDRYKMFLTYGGRDFCYYPYYNHENTTHPSYQIHPFLWNFVAKDIANINQLTKTILGYKVKDLETEEIKTAVDKYYGEFGQSVGEWLNPDIYDYSGYTTRYESSKHIGLESGRYADIIDYEGAFYPPAVEQLNKAISNGKFDNCLKSIEDAIAYKTYANSYFVARNSQLLTTDITSLLTAYDNYDENNNVTSYTYAKDLCIYNVLCSQVEPYVIDFNLSTYIDAYFKKNFVEKQYSDVSIRNFLTSLANDIEQTFYEKYYHHLPYMKDNDGERAYIAAQLCAYYPNMSSDILAEHDLSDAYDIYKYGYDATGNAYVLFKQYFNDDPTYKFKKNAVGQMWMRLKDQPFAFPLLTGEYPIANKQQLPSLITELSSEWPNLCAFYDFEISKDKTLLFLVSRVGAKGSDLTSSIVQQYENPWIIACNTALADKEDGTKLVDLIPLSSHECFIKSGANATSNPSLSAEPLSGAAPLSNYAFIGTYLKDNITTGFVYALKEYSYGNNVKLLNKAKVIHIENTGKPVVNNSYTANGSGLFNSSYGDQIVFSYDNGQLTFAYLKENKLNDSCIDVLSSYVSLSANTVGKTYGDPRSNEMNSHDIFTTDVAIVKCKIHDNEIKQDYDGNSSAVSKHNMNADMSWLPAYPGEEGELSLYLNNQLSGTLSSGLQVQLLGNSKNIDQQIAQVNDDVDPYADIAALSDNFVFGRTYEDYKGFKNNSYRLFKSPTVSTRDHQAVALEWTIDLTPYDYTSKTIDTLKLIAYSSKTLGKNPYLIASAAAISTTVELSDKWFSIPNYNVAYGNENSREISVETTIDAAGIEVDATGIYSKTKFLNRTDSNHIDGISAMQMQFIPLEKKLNIKLEIDSNFNPEHVHAEKDQLNVLLYTTSDLQIFNYYHYLDAYGVINVRDGSIVVPSPVVGDHWKIIYGKPELGKEADKFAERYILDENGIEHNMPKDQLDKYDALSDVYALQTNKRLSFKYSEEDVFPFDSENYYFPTLNIKYPKQLGDFVTSPSCQLEKAARAIDISGTFDDSNLFILDLANPDISSNFGRVEIEMSYDDIDCLEGFEKYTEFDDDCTISDDFNKFDVYDARAMYQVEFTEFGTSHTADVNEIANQIFGNEKYYDTVDFLSALELSVNSRFGSELSGEVVPFGLDQSTSKMLETVSFDVNSIDLSELMKMYVNYKKTDSGIVLYFNYYNYLNTPFVKIVGNKLYPDYIDNSFCRVGPNETGYVSIVIQLKYYVDNVLNGCKNVTLATYKVTNVSDDKPKFVIEEVSKLKRGDLKTINESPNVAVKVRDSVIQLSDYATPQLLSTCPEFSLYIDVETDRLLSAPYSIGVNYPYELARPNGKNGTGFDVDCANAGYFDITVTDPQLMTIKLGLSTSLSAQSLSAYANRYQVFVDKAEAYGQNDEVAIMSTFPGAIEIKL